MTLLLSANNKAAISYKDISYSFNQLLNYIHLYADLIHVNPNDKILIFSENRPEWIMVLYAAWSKECIVVPVDNLLTPEDVSFIIDDCKPVLCYTSLEKNTVLTKAIKLANHKPLTIILEHISIENLPQNNSPIEITNENKTAVILYTSGTTGKPKGVMLSFANIIFNIKAVTQKVAIINSSDSFICLLPFHHVLPLVGNIIIPMNIGCSIAISPSLQGNDIIETLQKNKITIIIGVPQLFEALRNSILTKIEQSKIASILFNFSKKINAHALSKRIFKAVHQKFGGHIKFFVSGGAALDKHVAKDLYTLGFDIIEGYGMTETAPLISFTYPYKWKSESVGFLMPDTKIKFTDNEICVKGEQVMQGYYNRPESTNETIIDGWLHTGDIGFIDKAGYLFITGRKKELIILSNGKNINPIEIEENIKLLNTNIIECACFAMHDQLHLMLVLHTIVGEEIIQKYIRTYNHSVPSYKQIRKFYITLEPLPKTRLGKIQRFQLSGIANTITKQKQTTTTPVSETYQIISNYLQKLIKQNNISPNDTFEFDLGLDSLNKISLIYFIQTSFGINITEAVLKEHPNVLSLYEHIEKNKNKVDILEINWNKIINTSKYVKLPSTWISIGFLKLLYSSVLKTVCTIRVHGKEHIPTTPFIIAANHQSYIDGFLINIALPFATNKKTFFYAKIKSFKNKLKQRLAIHHNVIIVDFDEDLEHSIQQLTTVLKQGKNIVIFPEGTRTRDGELNEFKTMYTILSKELQIPILPVVIKGAFQAMPPGRLLPMPGSRIDIDFLPIISPAGKEYETLNNEVKGAIESHL